MSVLASTTRVTGKGEGTLGLLVREIADDLHCPIEDTIRRKVIDVMRFHRDRRYFFSDREIRWNLTAGRQTYRPGDGYGLPADLVEIAGNTIWIWLAGEEGSRYACTRVLTPTWEDSRAAWAASSSQPEEWDFKTGGVRFNPTPESSADIAECRYISNLLIPRKAYEGGAYVYYHPTTGALLSVAELDAWTNDWLTQDGGQLAIRYRTMYELKAFLHNPEMAGEFLSLWLEHVGQLENETESKTQGAYELPGCILD